jgi:SAM-dependent methyltransferase
MYKEPNHSFGRHYFESDDQETGYRFEGYRDFECHFKTAQEVLNRNPQSVLEIGAGRGYVCKLIQNAGIPALAIDISEHCYHTRVVDKFIVGNITWLRFPISVPPQPKYDLAFSVSLLEHLPEEDLPDIIKKLAGLTNRGLHAVSFERGDDPTHITIHPKEWWEDLFATHAPDYPVEIVDKEEIEAPPYEVPLGGYDKNTGRMIKKINFGSFTTMFYYGWQNVDIIDMGQFADTNHYEFLCWDVRRPLPYPDEYADLIFMSHLLEHLPREEALAFLRECHRILKPDGVIRIATPDTEMLSNMYVETSSWHELPPDDEVSIFKFGAVNVKVAEAQTPLDALMELIIAGHSDLYDKKNLELVLKMAGFGDVWFQDPFTSASEIMKRETYVSHPTLSIVVEASK